MYVESVYTPQVLWINFTSFFNSISLKLSNYASKITNNCSLILRKIMIIIFFQILEIKNISISKSEHSSLDKSQKLQKRENYLDFYS